MLKHKTSLLVLSLLMGCLQGFSQVPVTKDTTVLGTTTDTFHLDDLKDNMLDNIPVVSLDENDGQDGSAQNISGQASANRDAFHNAAAYNFGVVRFRLRGYDADQFNTLMNGAPMENLDNGFTPFGLWGGLNDVMRNRTTTYGLSQNKLAYGSLGGTSTIDNRASRQRKQTSISYLLSNRNYMHRLMITHSTGLSKKGWAFSISGSRRWADEGFADGTYYNGWSFYTGLDKKFNDRHMLSFVAIATPTENGRQGSSVQEMLNIAGTNFYNPYWGYQNGKRRNASIGRVFQPIGVLTHEWKINPKATLLTAASYTFGDRSTTGIDWYNTKDPRPDYYRYLPSYYKDDTVRRQEMLVAMQNDVNLRQINWDAMYLTNLSNRETITNANGITGSNVTGNRSLYILEERVTNTRRYNVNTTLNAVVNRHIDLTAGLSFSSQRNHYYKKVDDLLGGAFYVDRNQFAERDFGTGGDASQNDLNNPNRILRVGDKFGYNYEIDIKRAAAWVQTAVKFRNLDFFVAAEHSYTGFYRYGNVRSGLFPNNSFGKSATQNFYNYAIKGGMTYKVTGGNFLFANASYESKAPFFDNAYVAARTRDFVQDNLKSEKAFSAEAGYILTAPTVKFRATGYYTRFRDQSNVLTFYNDAVRNFVNYALSNIGRTHFGTELGAEVILYKGLTLNAAAAIGRYRYDTRQSAVVTIDNSAEKVASEVVYSNNFYVPTPQEAYGVGLNYRSRQFWYVNVNFSYFDQMYLDFNPLRRTAGAVDGVDPSSALYRSIIDQTRLHSQYTLDAFAGYSWLLNKRMKTLKKRTFLVFNVGVNNILNNTNIVSGGFEQLRFDFGEKNIDKFPPRRFYAFGTNFSASVSLRF